jgi:tetratricopeptide (TPR) repeat protein
MSRLSLVIFFFFCISTAQTIDQTEIYDLFSQAKELLRQGNQALATAPDKATLFYQQAAMRFERIIREGKVRNGRLFYNLGNVYFRLGDLGHAILYYRCAEHFIPHDFNLQQNLRYARERRIDKIEEPESTKILKTIFFLHYDLTSKTRLILLVLFSSLFWISMSFKLFLHKELLRWLSLVFFILAILMLASVFTEWLVQSQTQEGIIIASEVIGRKGDSTNYQPSFQDPLHAGTEFKLIEKRSGWLYIELANTEKCWIPENSAKMIYSLVLFYERV